MCWRVNRVATDQTEESWHMFRTNHLKPDFHLFAPDFHVVNFLLFFACSCCQATCNSLLTDFNNVHVQLGMDFAMLDVISCWVFLVLLALDITQQMYFFLN